MIEIEDHTLDALLADDPGGPVVMLNLLRFRPDGGRESYQRYADALRAELNPATACRWCTSVSVSRRWSPRAGRPGTWSYWSATRTGRPSRP